ncbi:MAG: twitching motility protein PilT [wastewater metagenome]|nr:twitching motility protein PilT [Candidatus Loosdrechtia aerotolerans]
MSEHSKQPVANEAYFRFYAELNDFLPHDKVRRTFPYRFKGNPSIKDPIEAIGVPHTEVDLIIVNTVSVGFGYRLQNGDYVSVYPVFENIDISPVIKLRKEPLRKTAFILDVHLGKLAKILRMLGFDAEYRNDYHDHEIIQKSLKENRIILTRDRRLLHAKVVTHGYCIRSENPAEQLREVLNRFDLPLQIQPFKRCTMCNCELEKIEKSKIVHRLEPKTILYYNEFSICPGCDRIYWKGSHYEKLKEQLELFC